MKVALPEPDGTLAVKPLGTETLHEVFEVTVTESGMPVPVPDCVGVQTFSSL